MTAPLAATQAAALRWQTLRLRLQSRRWREGAKSSPLALLRAVALDASETRTQFDVIFELLGDRPAHLPLRRAETLEVEFRFFGATEAAVQTWCERVLDRMGAHAENNFLVQVTQPPQPRTAAPFFEETVHGDEAGLVFSTPLAFAARGERTQLPFAEFATLLQRRLRRAFGLPALPALPELRAIDSYWRFDKRLVHQSKSSKTEPFTLHGCSGAYFLRGDVRAWWPWLRLGQAALIGKRTTFGLGCYALSAPGPAVLTPRLGQAALLHGAFEQVMATHDDALVQLAADAPAPFDSESWCAQLGEQLRDGSFRPGPSRSFYLPKASGGQRRIERPSWEALIVARHLHDLLAQPLDRGFAEGSMAYRKGRSRDTAAAAVDAAIAAGCRHVVRADIDEFFPSVDLSLLQHDLEQALPRADAALITAAKALLHAGWVDEGGTEHKRQRGLAQGSPLSPLLANLHLSGVDHALARAGVQALRYADDVLLLCRDEAQAAQALALLRDDLAPLALQLDSAKTRIAAVAQGFEFLGFRFPRQPGDAQPVPPLRLPLHVLEPFRFLGLHGDALELRANGRLQDLVPLRRIDRILLHAPAALSTALLQRCPDRQQPIPIVFAAGPHGRALTVEPATPQLFEVAHRQASRMESMGAGEKLAVAKALVEAKIANSADFLRQRYRPGMNQCLAKLAALGSRLHEAADLDTLRGFEGAAARLVFAELAGFIEQPAFALPGRDREGHDRFNPLLNYGYYLLFLHINLELRGLGLNPFLGFLHSGEGPRRYEALVCDVQELFRAYIDRLLLRLVNLQVLDAGMFSEAEGRYRLGSAAMRAVALHFERELAQPLPGQPLPGQRLTLGQAISAQCSNMQVFLTEGASLYCHRWSKP